MKEIKGFRGYYITREGAVLSKKGQGCKRIKDDTVLTPIKGRPTKKGYLRVYIRRDSDNKRTDLYIHRIVAEHFIDNPKHKKCVNHKNSIRHDNRVENLEWVTYKENLFHAVEHGNMTICQNTGRFGRKVHNEYSD